MYGPKGTDQLLICCGTVSKVFTFCCFGYYCYYYFSFHLHLDSLVGNLQRGDFVMRSGGTTTVEPIYVWPDDCLVDLVKVKVGAP